MNNKILRNRKTRVVQDLQHILAKAYNNSQQLQYFYLRNKQKFPPILQSKKILINRYLPQNPQLNQTLKLSHQKKKYYLHQFLLHNSLQYKPSICNINFKKQKIKNSKNRYNSQSKSHLKSYKNTVEISKTLKPVPSKLYFHEQKQKRINFIKQHYTDKQDSLNIFFDSLKKQKSKILTIQDKSQEKKIGKSNNNSFKQLNLIPEPLTINKISQYFREDQFLRTIKENKKSIMDKTMINLVNTPEYKRSSSKNLKNNLPLTNLSKITFYKSNFGKFVMNKQEKSHVKRREFSKFQPWEEEKKEMTHYGIFQMNKG